MVDAVEGDRVTQRADQDCGLYERQVRQVVLSQRRNGLGELCIVVQVVLVKDIRP